MTDAVAKVDALIIEAEERLGDLEAKANSARVELQTLHRVRAALVGEPLGAAEGEIYRSAVTGRRRPRALSETWQQLLRFVGSRPSETAEIDELWQEIRRSSLDVSRNTLRSQLSVYADRGYLERVSAGTYRLTDMGRRACGLSKTNGQDVGSRAVAAHHESHEREHRSDTSSASERPTESERSDLPG